ncbi:hypothetical protein R1sor_021872 [Riccia sorocarpa]|uniref:DUF7869 domain-containing protein n=1 Tax=Riccia sorocarpa TaxID=122646 RepID=A0ABD3GJY3_9MARC
MKTIFQQAAEPLPHKESRNPNTDGIVYRMPKIYTRDDVYEEIRTKMLAVNLAPISKIAFNDIWRKDFPNYGIHTSSAFAKEMSTQTPNLYLSFIHDAMDHAKSYVPRLSDKLKSLMGHVTPLPLKLRDYETYFIGDCRGDLAFNTTLVHPLFVALIDGDVFKTTVLEKKDLSREEYFDLQQQQPISEGMRLKMLPHNLYIQLDNSAKDNKNWTVMAFCSELVARGCCKTITKSFLVVGHTYKDMMLSSPK